MINLQIRHVLNAILIAALFVIASAVVADWKLSEDYNGIKVYISGTSSWPHHLDDILTYPNNPSIRYPGDPNVPVDSPFLVIYEKNIKDTKNTAPVVLLQRVECMLSHYDGWQERLREFARDGKSTLEEEQDEVKVLQPFVQGDEWAHQVAAMKLMGKLAAAAQIRKSLLFGNEMNVRHACLRAWMPRDWEDRIEELQSLKQTHPDVLQGESCSRIPPDVMPPADKNE